MAKVIKETTEEISETKEVAKTAKVICERLNVRKVPSMKGDILEVISKGTTITLGNSKSDSDWVKVTLDTGVHGFVMKKFVK